MNIIRGAALVAAYITLTAALIMGMILLSAAMGTL